MREGYNVMDLSDIPESWDLVPLYDLRNRADRYSFTGGPFGSDLKSDDYTPSGVRIIQLQNIGEGEFVDKGYIYTSDEKADQLKSCNIYPNEIILAKMAPVARCCKIPDFTDRFVMCSDGIRLSVDKEKFDNEFVFQALNSDYFKSKAESQSTGTTRARIGLNDLKLIPIAIPKSFPEQQKIASILSTVDEKIANIDAQISQTRQLKKGLMQKLLTKGIGHTKFRSSELGEIPETWEVVKLETLVKIVSGCSPSDVEFEEYGTYNFYKVNQLNNFEKYMVSSPYRFTNGSLMPSGAIIFPKRGASIFTNKVRILSEDSFFDTNLMSLQCLPRLHNEYLYYFLLNFGLSKIADTSSIPQINNKHINPLKINLPSLVEQQQISSILATTDEKLDLLQFRKETCQQLKKGLMQQLLTGKIRVKTSLYEAALA